MYSINSSVPPEILVWILHFVDDTTLIKNVPAVCRKWRYVCRDLMKPMFSLGPEQWVHEKLKQTWLNCLVVRFTHAFKRSSTSWLGLVCENDAFEAAKLLLEGTEHDVDAIQHTMRPGYYDEVTDTLLGVALRKNKSKIVGLLLECGARVKNMKNEYPLHTASEYGHLDVVRHLVEAETTRFELDMTTSICTAAQNGHLNIVRYFVEKVGLGKTKYLDKNPIWIASCEGHLNVVRYLVDSGVYSNETGAHGWTSIHGAARNGHLDVVQFHHTCLLCLHVAAENGYLDIVRYLVEEGGQDAGTATKYGRTPIHVAADKGHLNVVRYLVEEAEVDFNKSDDLNDLTPLGIATLRERADVTDYLRSIGAKCGTLPQVYI